MIGWEIASAYSRTNVKSVSEYHRQAELSSSPALL
jgi:hypothetical protein